MKQKSSNLVSFRRSLELPGQLKSKEDNAGSKRSTERSVPKCAYNLHLIHSNPQGTLQLSGKKQQPEGWKKWVKISAAAPCKTERI